MTPGQLAEALIAEYGISDPRDLDIEAIAFESGINVEYQQLTGCEATLVGFGKHAIATVKPSKVRGRERFSIAHELGHWKLHRGKSFRCRIDEPDENMASDQVQEKEADAFAAHALMPASLFNPRITALGNPGFREIEELSSEFQTSVLATSLRLADINTLPMILACYGAKGLRWYKAAADVPQRWWLQNNLCDDSFAYDLFTEGKQRTGLGKQPAEVWFENSDAENYEVMEHCIPGKSGEVLVLLYLTGRMLDARYDPNVGNRRYNEYGSYVTRR